MRNVIIVLGSVAIAVGTWALVDRASRPADTSGTQQPSVSSTSRDALNALIAANRRHVADNPGDGAAAVVLADALMRAARVNGDASLPVEAEGILRTTLAHGGVDYAAQRMLSVVYLAQHRFAEALEAATAAQELRPADAWNYAIAGDALLELGRYDEAFDSFDKAIERRPDAGGYARAAYARELQGDLEGAVRFMRMSAEATSPQDHEALAWTFSQLGNLYLHQERLGDAERELRRADFMFPAHPYAQMGRVRLAIRLAQFADALRTVNRVPPSPETLAIRGDLLARLGDAAGAETAYRESERMEREGWAQEQPQPGALARFLAERGRNIQEAVALAERAASERKDINTMDALAWAYFKAGRVDAAASAIRQATRTGTADARIRCHAAVISAVRAGAQPAACDVLRPDRSPL